MAEWTTAYINNLPDASFAYIESGGTKDAEGKTVPRSLRHFPYKDADGKIDRPHLANAMARAKQSPFGDRAMSKLMAAEKQVGMGMGAGKADIDEDDLAAITQDEIDSEVIAGDEEPDDDDEPFEGKAGPKFVFGRPNPAYTAGATKRDVSGEMDAIRGRAQARGLKPTDAQVRRTYLRNLQRRQSAGIRQRAIQRFGRAPSEAAVRGTLRRNMTRDARLGALFGSGPAKAAIELKAQDLTHRQLDAWLAGEISRRVLVLPFGGPLPGGPKGRDLDGEFFDERTDIYGPFPWLRQTRERLVDWHHDDLGVPDSRASRMKGAVIGRIVLDDEPEEDGYWADWWAKAGERRLALVKLLEKNRVPLFGSTEPVKGSTHVEPDGHIDLWPIIRHTITTSPQNTWAVVPPLKALLSDPDVALDDVGLIAVKAALVGIDALTTDLLESSADGDPLGALVAAARGRGDDDLDDVLLEGISLALPRLVRSQTTP